MARALAFLMVSLMGCDKPPHQLDWVLEGDVSVLSRVTWVEASIRQGGCDGSEVYREEFSLADLADVRTPNRLSPGRHGFLARVQDETCTWIAEGCTEIALPAEGAVVVVLDAVGTSVGTRACAPVECQAGICIEPPMPDSAVDVPTPDASVACDDGTEPPCESCVGDTFALGRLEVVSDIEARYPTAFLGPDARVHVSYRTGSGPVVYASRPLSGLFRAVRVDDMDEPGDHLAMVADASGMHMVYVTRGGSQHLSYAYRASDDAPWVVEEIAPEGADGADIVSGPAGLFVVWSRSDSLWVAERDPGGGWDVLPESPVPDVGGRSVRPRRLSAAIAGDGTLHVALRNEDRGAAVYARRDPAGGWTAESLRDDRRDSVPAVVWSETVGLRVVHATKDGELVVRQAAPGAATLSPMAAMVDADIGTEIAAGIDTAGVTHIVYNERSSGPLLYRTFSASGLSASETVASVVVGDQIAIALDGETPTIVFLDSERELVKEARRRGAGDFETHVVDAGDRHRELDAAIDADGRLVVAMHDDRGKEVRAVCRSTDGDWSIAPIPGAASDVRTSMAMTSGGGLLVLYVDSSTSTLALARRPPATDWSTEMVAGARNYDAVAVAARSDGGVVAAFVSERTLFHTAASQGGAWSIPREVSGNVDPRVDVASTSDGTVHVVYSERSGGGDLKHARIEDGVDSLISPIDLSDADGFAIVASVSGLLHVAYHRGSEVFYAIGTSDGSWFSRLVARAPDRAAAPSIALDAVGGVGVSFAAGTDTYTITEGVRRRTGTNYRTQYVYAPAGMEFLPSETVQGFDQNGGAGTTLVFLPDGSPFVTYWGSDRSRQLRTAVGPSPR